MCFASYIRVYQQYHRLQSSGWTAHQRVTGHISTVGGDGYKIRRRVQKQVKEEVEDNGGIV